MSFPRECPNSYECAHSNVGNTHVCCRMTIDQISNTPLPFNPVQGYLGNLATVTFRPPIDEITCPTGYKHFINFFKIITVYLTLA